LLLVALVGGSVKQYIWINNYNIAFVNSERWLAKSRVDITQCQHGNVGKFLSLCFFVLYSGGVFSHNFEFSQIPRVLI
jgi:hypothetical protein